MLKSIRTEFIFTLVALLSLLSVALVVGMGLSYIPAVVLTFGLNVWSMAQSDQDGFIKQRGMPRAGDPQRQFHPVQTVILILIMFFQVIATSFIILTT